jgi:nitroimidazol reductase NimA-like FMN-containing flavoprotein (pyridoxamine 5'-phosphate oxidase superfamily)
MSESSPPETATSWEAAVERLTSAHTYWLATVRANGPPHVMPVWAVWLEGGLWLSTSGSSTKGRNIAREPRCTVTLDEAGMQLVVEGDARRVTDNEDLQRFVAAYTPKYGWPMTIRDGAVHFEDGNSGFVYAVRAETVFAFVEEPFTSTRWQF